MPLDRQVTFAPHGHILTNVNVWSPDGRRVVYDVRSDADGSAFDGTHIETVDADTAEVRTVYTSRDGARCGVATYHPRADRVVFILGPEHPTPDWSYGPSRRQGVIVDVAFAGPQEPERTPAAERLDARDLAPPYTPGALRGGSHVHTFSPDGHLVSFTYEDEVLAERDRLNAAADLPAARGRDTNVRNVGVSVVGRPVAVRLAHPRNHAGSAFSVLVTRAAARPEPGSDEYSRAYEEGWVGTAGYRRADGSRQARAIAFLGDVGATDGRTVTEVFLADLPDDLTRPGGGPLAGTPDRMPYPPAGVAIRRLTRTADRRFPGVCGPRHWVRSSPDGSRLAFLMRDDAGTVQVHTVSPLGGEPTPLTRGCDPVASAVTWSPDGRWVAHVAGGCVWATDAAGGPPARLTSPPADPADAPLPLACVVSPDGRRVTYLRRVRLTDGRRCNQIFVADMPRP